MKSKKVFLLLNGEKPKQLPDLSDYDVVCTTDGAYHFLEKYSIVPDFVAGDLDSLKSISNEIELIETPNQDYTDFDKILQILFDRGFYKIDIYGASGKQQDHFLGNLHTAIQWKKKLKLTFFDNYQHYFLADKKTIIQNCKDKIISLVPFPKASKISTQGLEFPLHKEDLSLKKRMSTRNKATTNKVEITFKRGNLFIFINNHENE